MKIGPRGTRVTGGTAPEAPLGSIWAIQGPPGRPHGSQDLKKLQKGGSRTLPGTPLGEPFRDNFWKKCRKRRAGTGFVGCPAPLGFFAASRGEFGAPGLAQTAIIAERGIENQEFQECWKMCFWRSPGVPFWRVLEVFVLIFGSRNRLGVIFGRSKERSKKASEKIHSGRREVPWGHAGWRAARPY